LQKLKILRFGSWLVVSPRLVRPSLVSSFEARKKRRLRGIKSESQSGEVRNRKRNATWRPKALRFETISIRVP
jgi:hypothetical protein